MCPECEFSIPTESVAPMFYIRVPKSNQNENLKGLIQLPANPQNFGHS